MKQQRLGRSTQALVCVWAALCLVAIFLQGRHDGLDRHVTNRLRYHAIPVALSVLYHGRPHDYTAFTSLAFAFQDTTDIETKIAWAVRQQPAAGDPTYYWAADDRGMGDYVIAAFALFGPHAQSLYSFYFVVLGASVLLFLADLSWHAIASAMLVFALAAMYTCASVVPLGNLTLPIFEAGSLYEPRVIELLSYVATLHLGMTPWFGDRWTIARRAIVAGQAAILIACYHARSTVAWELTFVLLSSAACWVWRRRDDLRSGSVTVRSTVLAIGWPALCLVAGLGLLKVYQHATYNPRYFSDMGTRTVWHNALMGFWVNNHLSDKYQLRVDDRMIVSAVRTYLHANGDPRLTTEWTESNILGALGGHSVFNWLTYESAARDLYWHIWKADAPYVLHTYAIDKPREIARVLAKAVNPPPSLLEEVHDLGFKPLAPTALLLVAPGVLLLCAHEMRFWAIVCALFVLFACSIVPGWLFYPVVHTMMGAFATLALIVYVVLAQGIAAVVRLVRRPGWSPA